MTYLSAPVSVLTPPAGQRVEVESLEAYWQQDQAQYSALLVERRLAVPADAIPEDGGRRAIGRRRGRSSDHRLWLGLGGVVIVAAAAIFGIVKFEFGTGGGPAHMLVTPQRVASFTHNRNLDKSADLGSLMQKFRQMGHMTGVVSQAYSSGAIAGGVPPQSFVVLEGHLPNQSPSASLASFMSTYPGAVAISAGPLGGKAACVEAAGAQGQAALCAWFDNDTVGVFMSSTMAAKDLANVAMTTFRPVVELSAN